jgi:hypothetical protein
MPWGFSKNPLRRHHATASEKLGVETKDREFVRAIAAELLGSTGDSWCRSAYGPLDGKRANRWSDFGFRPSGRITNGKRASARLWRRCQPFLADCSSLRMYVDLTQQKKDSRSRSKSPPEAVHSVQGALIYAIRVRRAALLSFARFRNSRDRTAGSACGVVGNLHSFRPSSGRLRTSYPSRSGRASDCIAARIAA